MILRRLTKHVKDQNWFAVGLDFIIVVFGVFIGLQVNNWNAASAERAAERQLLSQIQNDVEMAVALKTEWLDEMGPHRRSLLEAVVVIQNQPEQQTLSYAQCRAMWSSHLLFYPVAPMGSVDELLSKGQLHTSLGRSVRPTLLRFRSPRTHKPAKHVTYRLGEFGRYL